MEPLVGLISLATLKLKSFAFSAPRRRTVEGRDSRSSLEKETPSLTTVALAYHGYHLSE
jgi:hypothetical protein